MKSPSTTPLFTLPKTRAVLLYLLAEDLKFRSLYHSLQPVMGIEEEWQVDLFPAIKQMISPAPQAEYYDVRADYWAQQYMLSSRGSLEDCALLLFAELCSFSD